MKEQNTYLPVKKLMPDPDQPSKEFSEESLLALSQFLKRDGVLQPVRVRPFAAGYVIVLGEPQWRAARIAGLATVACVIEMSELESNCDSRNESDDPDCRKLLERVLGESAKTVERVLSDLHLTQEEQAQTRRTIATKLEGDIARVISAVTLKALIPIPSIAKVARRHFPKDKRPWHCEISDLTQELALKLEKLSKRILDACPHGSVPAFLAGIVTNIVKDGYHENGRWPEALGDKAAHRDFDERCDPRICQSEINEVVSGFPPLARQIIERRLWGDDWEEIAAAMQLPVKKVKAIAQRAFREGGSSS